MIGTPTSQSCKPLIAEDDYGLTVDCCLQVLYLSHNWYRPVFGFSVYPTTEVVNPETFKLVYLMKEFLYQKMDDMYFDQLIKSYRLPSKKILSVLVQKLIFAP